jgi:LacI family transcriptional regulator
MGITSKELAKICGVSIGTVDRAMNDRPGINPVTKEKILRVSREVGYRPHLVARSLKTGKTMTVGIVVYDLDNRFFAQLVNSLERTAKESEYFVYLTLSNHDLSQERECLEHLAGLNVDGILIVPTNQGHEFTQFLSSLQLPVVAIGNKLSPAIPFVGIQDREAMRAAVELVVQKGYRRIIYVSPPLSYRGKENIYEVEERFEGFREAVKAQALESVVIREKHFADSLSDVVMQSHLRTAIMCSSDIYALQCLDSLGSWGMRVPEDVGLIGFDDIDVLKYVKPALTSISYPVAEIVKQAFALLKRLMDGERGPMSPPLVETNIVFRESL